MAPDLEGVATHLKLVGHDPRIAAGQLQLLYHHCIGRLMGWDQLLAQPHLLLIVRLQRAVIRQLGPILVFDTSPAIVVRNSVVQDAVKPRKQPILVTQVVL